MMKPAPATIDEYLITLSPDVKRILEKLRQTIKSVAPKAEEVISYGMPAFKYYGMLVYFAAFKNHCSLFPASGISTLKEEVKPFRTSKGTLQFTVDRPIPVSLVKQIVKLRIKENEAKQQARLLKKSSVKRLKKANVKSKD